MGFTRPVLANTGAAISLHTYALFTGMLAMYGPMGLGAYHAADFCIEIACAYAEDPKRESWIQEFGGLEEEFHVHGLRYLLEQTIRNATGCRGVGGFTWWCSHDFYGRYAELSSDE